MTNKEALNVIADMCNALQLHPNSRQGEAMMMAINSLKNVTLPVENKGKWIELPKAFNANENPCECSKCGHVLSFMNHYPKSNFCPNCGADMRGE